MKQLHTALALAYISICTLSCTSPQKAIEKGKYTKAMNLATKKIKKGKEVDLNQQYLRTAASAISEQTLQDYYARHNSTINDWKVSQTRFNKVLSDIGKNNIKTQGMVADSYDKLCNTKYDLDLKIVDYYYQEGIALLDDAMALGKTKFARQAYHEFELSEKEGASHFYHDLESLKEECIEHGSIYVIAPSDFNDSNKFIYSIPKDSNQKADCIITIDYGYPNVSESTNTSQKTHQKKVVVGQNTVTDTTGKVTYEDILQDVYAYENINQITYTARQHLSVDVEELTSECFLKSRSVNLCETEVCTEINYTGDLRAVPNSSNTSCNRSSLSSEVSNDIRGQARRNLYAAYKKE